LTKIYKRKSKRRKVKRRNWKSIKEQYAFKFPQLMGRVLLLVLALLIVVCIDIGATMLTHHSTSSPPSTRTPQQNTIHYDDIEETAVAGSVKVNVTLAEYTIGSSKTAFRAGTTYYFVVANRGQDVHEFLIIPEKPDGSELSPDLQYKDKLIEIEQIAPGTTMRINYTFSPSAAGRYEIACQMRGHYQAGMKLPIRVTR
jgi:uncharacterized cupredoxin-like copper-binding protein